MKKNIKKHYRQLFIGLFIFTLIILPSFVSAQTTAWNVGNLQSYGLPGSSGNVTIYGIIRNILTWILGIFGFLGILGFVISGIMYLLSAGDDDQMKNAKKAMQYSIIGVIVGLSGLVLIMAADAMLNAYGSF